MRANSRAVIATGAAAVTLLGLTACGPTAGSQEPGEQRSIFDQPMPTAPTEAPADLDDTDTIDDTDTLDDTIDDTDTLEDTDTTTGR